MKIYVCDLQGPAEEPEGLRPQDADRAVLAVRHGHVVYNNIYTHVSFEQVVFDLDNWISNVRLDAVFYVPVVGPSRAAFRLEHWDSLGTIPKMSWGPC